MSRYHIIRGIAVFFVWLFCNFLLYSFFIGLEAMDKYEVPYTKLFMEFRQCFLVALAAVNIGVFSFVAAIWADDKITKKKVK